MSEVVLYRKYRPMVFSDLVGQEHVIHTLRNAVSKGEAGHAYLLAGSRGVGKTTIARIMAKAINCLNLEEGNPCNKCSICNSFNDQSSMDLIEVDAASHRGIDDVRFLQEGANFAPVEARRKVFIIDEVHMLTKEAFNALLKTLEEPPNQSVFILATTQMEKVPETVVSRCQVFHFSRLSVTEIADYLVLLAKKEKVELDREASLLIAENVSGGMRDALGVLEQLLILGADRIDIAEVMKILGLVEESILEKIVFGLIDNDLAGTLNFYFDNVYTKGVDIKRLIRGLEIYLRRLIVLKSGAKYSGLVGENSMEHVSVGKLVMMMEKIQEVKSRNYEVDSLYFEMFSVMVVEESRGEDVRVEKKNDIKELKDEIKSDMPEIREKGDNQDFDTSKWVLFVDEILKEKPLIGSMLKMGRIESVDQEKIFFKVGFEFHKSQLEAISNRMWLQDKMSRYFGESKLLECSIDNKMNKIEKKVQNRVAPNDVLSDIVEVFGGKIID